jgi:hypothetical protein
MRLARTVEPGNPRGALVAPTERGEERLKDAHQPAPILAVGHKGLEFAAQRLSYEPALRWEDDLRNALI